jgi:geranylgeranyl diphosphate synthase type I
VTARRIGALKSGGYSIADPLAIGALCVSEDAATLEMLERCGRPLGEAFQLRDDVLGVFGDPSQTGKDRDGDLREGKQTVLLTKARAAATAAQLAVLDRAVGTPDLTEADAERVRGIIAETGALRATNELIDELTAQATGAIDAGLVGAEAARALHELADEVTRRQR